MEGEERNKVGSKRRSKQVEVVFDSGDDETIGSFLKLKSKRNTKKNKLGLGSSGVKNSRGDEKSPDDDENLIAMDDTLASFRRKLRAPKKDGGRVALVGNDIGNNFLLPSNQPLHQLVEDVGLAMKVSEEVLVDADGGDKGTIDKELELVAEKKTRKPRVTLEAEKIGSDSEPNESRRDHQRSGKGSSDHEKLVLGEDSLKCSDDGLEDSLSTFFRKAQSGFIRKSRSSLRLKLEKETKHSSDGSRKKSNDVLEDPLSEFTRKSPFSLKLSNEVAESNEDVHLVSAGDMIGPVLTGDENDNALLMNFPGASSSVARNSSSSLVACETLRSSENFADASTLKIPENTGSPTNLRICSNTLLPVQYTQTSSIDLTRSNSVSINHAPEAGQRTCPLDGGEVLLSPDYESPNRECEDKSPCSRRLASVGIMQPSTYPIEDPSTLQDKNNYAENSHDELDYVKSVQNSGQVQMVGSLSYPTAPEKELSSKHRDYLDKDAGNGIVQTVASISPRKEYPAVLEHNSSPKLARQISNYETNFQVKDLEKSLRHSDDSNNSYESPTPDDSVIRKCHSTSNQNKRFDFVSQNTCLLLTDACLPGDEDTKGTSSPSDVPEFNEDYAEPSQVLPDSENKTTKLSAVQRRKAKKRRHGDMTYEGDADWEVLMQEQEFVVTSQLEDVDQSSKTREKFSSSLSTNLSTVNCGAAAVSAGLKACAVGPVEKIKFKDILKRKGGLQEYLECRFLLVSSNDCIS